MDSSSVRTLFSEIATGYDKANAVMSFGLHWRWNSQLVKRVQGAFHLLDLCAGTGEIAFTFLKRNPKAEAVLLDFCPEMLACATKKGIKLQSKFQTIEADAVTIPFQPCTFDAVTIAYGIRNVKEPIRCFAEAHRVLRYGGRFVILELTRPSNKILQLGHAAYLKLLIPSIGKLITRKQSAYAYLARSIASFSDPEILIQNLYSVGFKSIKKTLLLGGTATLIDCQK